EQRARIVHHLDHPIALLAEAAPHHLEHVRLELAPRLDMDVDVGDTGRRVLPCDPGAGKTVTHGAQKVPPDGGAFNRTVQRTASGRHRSGCATATFGRASPVAEAHLDHEIRGDASADPRGSHAAMGCGTCARAMPGDQTSFDPKPDKTRRMTPCGPQSCLAASRSRCRARTG